MRFTSRIRVLGRGFTTSLEEKDFSRRIGAINPESERVYSIRSNNIIKGHATEAGTKKYSLRNPKIHVDNFQTLKDLKLTFSFLGYGTYLGDPSTAHDKLYYDAIVAGVTSGGVNVIDTAINYRYMKSERTVGAAIKHLTQELGYGRDELILCSKGGYVSEDADRMGLPAKRLAELVSSGKVDQSEIVADTHCMNPAFLEYQLNQSLQNMQIDTLDIYYIHNSAESQLALLGDEKYYKRLEKTFEFMEEQVALGKIKYYGMATYNCFRSPPEEDGIHVSIRTCHEIAKRVGGENHHFKFLQIPVNIICFEAAYHDWQLAPREAVIADFEAMCKASGRPFDSESFIASLPSTSLLPIPALKSARLHSLHVMGSSPFQSSLLLSYPLSSPPFPASPPAPASLSHLQFLHSIPLSPLLSVLVGNKSAASVSSNLQSLQLGRLTQEEFFEYIMKVEAQGN